MANEQKLCKDGFRPVDEMQYRTACIMFGNWSCCWQRWKEGADHTKIFACRNMSRDEAGQYIGEKAIEWVIKKYPEEEEWIRGEVKAYNFGAEDEPEPEDPPFGGWNPGGWPGTTPDPTPDPTPEPTGDCSACEAKIDAFKAQIIIIKQKLQEIINGL